MGRTELEHKAVYTDAWQVYREYINPGKVVVSLGPNNLESDATVLEASVLDPDFLYIADPRSDSHPIKEEDVWKVVGPVDMETTGNIDKYIAQIHELRDQFAMHLREPIWLGPAQGVLHIELPDQQKADVIMDRGTTGFVIAEDDRYADIREELLFQAFEADRSALKDGGVLILQTNHISHGYRKFPWEIWNISIPELLLRVGFSSVSYHRVADAHIVPITDETARLIHDESEREYERQDLLLFSRLSRAIKGEYGRQYLEFSKKTDVGIHTKVYQDMYIATA